MRGRKSLRPSRNPSCQVNSSPSISDDLQLGLSKSHSSTDCNGTWLSGPAYFLSDLPAGSEPCDSTGPCQTWFSINLHFGFPISPEF